MGSGRDESPTADSIALHFEALHAGLSGARHQKKFLSVGKRNFL
jgi:hypothetical protein